MSVSRQRILIFYRRVLYGNYKNTMPHIMRVFNKAWWKIRMIMSGAAARTSKLSKNIERILKKRC